MTIGVSYLQLQHSQHDDGVGTVTSHSVEKQQVLQTDHATSRNCVLKRLPGAKSVRTLMHELSDVKSRGSDFNF